MIKRNFINLSIVASVFLLQPLHASTNYAILQKSWDLINYKPSELEAQGLNGENMVIGIVDSTFSTTHPSLQGQSLGILGANNYQNTTNNSATAHGSHVAGVILGKNVMANEPHGIAPEAKFYGVAYLDPTLNGQWDASKNSVYDFFASKNIKVINNSFGTDIYPIINKKIDYTAQNYFNVMYKQWQTSTPDSTSIFNLIDAQSDKVSSDLVRLAKEKKILQVFSAGNEGMSSPILQAALPSYDHELRSWLAVGSLSAYSITKDSSGKIIIDNSKPYNNTQTTASIDNASDVSVFSNHFKGAASYGVMAPGQFIDSANSYYQNTQAQNLIQAQAPGWSKDYEKEFINMSGTSQAAPMVSGAATLIAQKFKFLDGAQIADVILSTANKDYQAPNILLKRSPLYGSLTNGGAADKLFWNIVYIKDSNGNIKDANGQIISGIPDEAQVKKDLQALGFSQASADEIWQYRYQSTTNFTNTTYDGVQTLSKEEVFGQGILDINKALKGLSILDANRLNAKSVESFNNEKVAFYTLDTKGYNAEFSNNISQQEWVEGWHLDPAFVKNYPTELKAVQKIGLIKEGDGILTLSDNTTHTYKGPTRVKGGILELKGSLQNSDAYAERGGIFLLNNGNIANNATAQDGGILRVQSANNTIGKSTLAKNSGEINLLSGSRLNANGGILLENGGILSGAGTISGNVVNKSGILKAGFDKNTTELRENQNTLSITGNYTQNVGNSLLQIAFDSNDSINNLKAINSKLLAAVYNIQGGELEYVSIFKNGDKTIKDGDTLDLELDGLESHLNNFSDIKINGTNTLTFELDSSDKSIIHAKLKDNAYTPDSGNSDFGGALENLSQGGNSQEYEDFFGNLDINTDKATFAKVINSLEKSAPTPILKDNITLHNKILLDNTSFLLKPFMSGQQSSANAAKVAMSDSDLISPIFKDIWQDSAKRSEFSLNAGYGYLDQKGYSSDTFSLIAQGKKELSDSAILGSFFDYSYSKGDDEFVKTNANLFTAGLNGIYSLGNSYSLLGGVSVGYGINETERSILGATHRLSGDYNSYNVSVQGGVAKDIDLSYFVLKPLVLLNYIGTKQSGYSESGGIFAKTYEGDFYNNFSTSLGLNAAFSKEFAEHTLFLDTFAFYNLRFNNTLTSIAAFSDAPGDKFESKSELDKHNFYFGINAKLQGETYFSTFGISSELGRNHHFINAILGFGARF
ncbi:MAG: S8 family serine peptidase [Helicobacter sp.]|nr:S8 family serine peptidase [Helicobacter sp.]